ncbi:MAG: nqo3 [Gammaproteobacteria bacterium]|nr:nqo3 [Gammaproteobacteria bacterium]
MSDIDIEIDGKLLKAKPNSMVIQVADEAGIYIPRFCYHKHLPVAANCRMCLVEMDKSPKAVPACATPVMSGMKIWTRSPKALAAQKAVMEFLLINHPLDCPICDQGGECELQDLSMGYGAANSYFTYGKRAVADQDIGPLIETEMTRCIQCTRCVRFGDEIAGLRELGAIGRGEHMEISTYVTHAIKSEVSGNIIDLCPVGALTSKPFRFTARAWELKQSPSIAPHDCLGTHINVHTRAGKVMRVVPRENKALNETWIADRERYSYLGLYQADRVTKPLIRVHDHWQETDWQTALNYTVEGLQQVISQQTADQMGALVSPNATTEEFFLLQKLWRQLGSSHIDHRLRQIDFSDQDSFPVFPQFDGSIADLENYSTILLVGSNIQKEQPLIALRLRKAVLKGTNIFAVNMMDYAFNFKIAGKKIAAPHEFIFTLAGIAKVLLPEQADLAEVSVSEEDRVIAERLRAREKSIILLGALALNHPQAALIRWLVHQIAKATECALGLLTEGSNAAGAWLAGAIPHRTAVGEKVKLGGLDAQSMWKQARQAYLLVNVEPDLDCANAVVAKQALAQAKFVVSLSVFKNPLLDCHADVILPIAPFTETAGTFVNVAGQWQSFKGVAQPYGESRPAWKVLCVLGHLFHLPGFDYASTEEVLQELKLSLQRNATTLPEVPGAIIQKNGVMKLSRLGEIPLYAGDSLVRRAHALQSTQAIIEGELLAVRMNPQTARELKVTSEEKIKVRQQGGELSLPVIFDKRVPPRALSIFGGLAATTELGELFGAIEVIK